MDHLVTGGERRNETSDGDVRTMIMFWSCRKQTSKEKVKACGRREKERDHHILPHERTMIGCRSWRVRVVSGHTVLPGILNTNQSKQTRPVHACAHDFFHAN